jgi:GTPase SAR1 family protein
MQNDVICRQESQSILRSARDCSTSLLGLDDSRSLVSETTAGISAMFDFDAVILNTRIYQAAERSHLRQAIRARKNKAVNWAQRKQKTWGIGIPADGPHGDDSTKLITSAPLPEEGVEDSSKMQVQRIWTPRQVRAPRLTDWLKKPPKPITDQDCMDTEENRLVHHPRKVLILGSSESGKTTLLNTLIYRQTQNFLYGDWQCYVDVVWSNAVTAVLAILEAMEDLRIPLGDEATGSHVETIFMQPSHYDTGPPVVLADAVSALWKDSGFQQAYKRRCEYQLQDSAFYYISHIERLVTPGYIPTCEDILRTSVRTSGILGRLFRFRDVDYHILDVGGARAERKKWHRAMGHVATVIFTVDPTAYAKPLAEDETVNRMLEQFTLFESIANSRWFADSELLIIFTKMDLLEGWLHDHPVEQFFTDFWPSDNFGSPVEQYMQYLESRLISLIKSPGILGRTRTLQMNLVDFEADRPAQVIFEMLDSFAVSHTNE